MSVDGMLEEPIYEDVPALTGFVQTIPDHGAPATQETEA